jgi:hypothetical protein
MVNQIKRQRQREELEKRLVKLEDLGLSSDLANIQLSNPLLSDKQEDLENPHIHLLRIMRKPEYFHFTCKHILNIDLSPISGSNTTRVVAP